MDNNIWKEAVSKQFKKEEVPIVLDILTNFEKYAVGEAILYLSKGDLKWVRKYAKIARKRPDELLKALTIKQTLGQRDASKLVDVTPWKRNNLNIDKLLEPITSFLNGIQHPCLYGCCGPGNLSVEPTIIQSALKNMDAPKILKSILLIQLQIRQSPKTAMQSTLLNGTLSKEGLLEVFKTLRNRINNEIQSNKNQGKGNEF